ncbi:PREDICTED: snRNA-activating protein complex subunit 1-like [Amphimedon queenslandica]|uniref:snRNA-activating protein complex subunit 1 n=1 Tax=Amphimedon queenslandica TaxID=400682 RepID=A0A1X7UBS4_AMPQE|nr:PREDICTED: snRNA-activating protein complex subunit 1-like [Amphimedon queenslandica]|eukprot:XP_011405500.1 PREDICTED: snRNA-activating protein complex subunit 1-like [Amphimedon queenslandica]
MEAAMTRDAMKLLNSFSSKERLDFDEFKKLWKEYHFYYIHDVNNEYLVKRDTYLESILCTSTSIVSNPSFSLYKRVGAIFMLYSLFVSQPGTVRIRLSISDWEVFQQFQMYLRSAGHADPDFALCKLKSLSAFLICAERQKLCLGQHSETADKQLVALRENSRMDFEKNILSDISKLQESLRYYTSLKLNLSYHLPPHLLSTTSPFEAVATLEKIRELQEVEEDEEREEEMEGRSNMETQRQQILRRAYKAPPKKVLKNREVQAASSSSAQ